LGRIAGAQIIVSGAVSRVGDLYRLRVRALSVESAQIVGQFNRNISDGPTIAALAQSRATGYGGGTAAAPSGTAASSASAAPAAPVTPAVPAPVAQSEPAVPVPEPVVYKIGDKGPAGGIVFYDKGVVTNGWRYLEAAPNDIGPAQWGSRGTEISGINTAVGTGKANTQRIVPVLEQAGEDGAALLCTAMNINGHTGWFLPSKDELNLMYVNLKAKGLGGFGNGQYWSSSQGDPYGSSYSRHAWTQKFSDGSLSGPDKNETLSVRAARQF
jgi:hypothetical protein